jgi:hypothetical protein
LVAQLREVRTLRVFENKMVRRIFGSQRDGVRESGENYTMRRMICTFHHMLFG